MIFSLALSMVLAGGGFSSVGYEESTYKGKWYVAAHESIRKCIMWRESRYNYRAANRSSSARGAYQFLDSQWRRSLTYMLMPEHRDRKQEVIALRAIPIHEWDRYWQDASFWAAWRKGEGRHHWSLQRSQCW
jgi:hypothetical protein